MQDALNYPFDPAFILRKKKAIKPELLKKSDLKELNIAILGGSTTAEIKDILELFLLKYGFKPNFYESEFNKYYEDIMFDNEKLLNFKPHIIYIHTTSLNINSFPELTDSDNEIQQKLNNELERFKAIWKKIKESYRCPIIQNNFELPYARHLGNLDFSNCRGKTNFIAKINLAFAQFACQEKDFYINDINYLSSWVGLEKWHDLSMWYSYKYALSYDAVPFLAHNISAIIQSIYGKSKKCLVFDLDNTLWGGIIGEDGLENIQIGKETALAEAYSAFQKYVRELNKRGLLLAVCSKNDHQNAKAGLSHPDNIISPNDIICFKANWDPKHANIVKIAEEINIGLDSIVFIDDDPVEREEVRSNLSLVEVPEVGSDVVKYIEFLDKGGYFEPVMISSEDFNRVQSYKDNVQRKNLQFSFKDYTEFLKSLEMKAQIHNFEDIYLERITQLINKTNQFNLTAKRYTLSQIKDIAKNPRYISLYARLLDKFGDNGIVSAAIGNIKDSALHIELWLMSCRVLKRGLEYAMFDALVSICKTNGIKQLVGYFYKTGKNQMVAHHYKDLGFKCIAENENGDSTWQYDLTKVYLPRNKIIQVETGTNGK